MRAPVVKQNGQFAFLRKFPAPVSIFSTADAGGKIDTVDMGRSAVD